MREHRVNAAQRIADALQRIVEAVTLRRRVDQRQAKATRNTVNELLDQIDEQTVQAALLEVYKAAEMKARKQAAERGLILPRPRGGPSTHKA